MCAAMNPQDVVSKHEDKLRELFALVVLHRLVGVQLTQDIRDAAFGLLHSIKEDLVDCALRERPAGTFVLIEDASTKPGQEHLMFGYLHVSVGVTPTKCTLKTARVFSKQLLNMNCDVFDPMEEIVNNESYHNMMQDYMMLYQALVVDASEGECNER